MFFHHGPETDAPDEAVKLIGRNATGVRASNLDYLDRLFDTARRET